RPVRAAGEARRLRAGVPGSFGAGGSGRAGAGLVAGTGADAAARPRLAQVGAEGVDAVAVPAAGLLDEVAELGLVESAPPVGAVRPPLAELRQVDGGQRVAGP